MELVVKPMAAMNPVPTVMVRTAGAQWEQVGVLARLETVVMKVTEVTASRAPDSIALLAAVFFLLWKEQVVEWV